MHDEREPIPLPFEAPKPASRDAAGGTPGIPYPGGPAGPLTGGPVTIAPASAAPPRITRNVVLFLITLATTTYWGFLQYQQYYFEEGDALVFNPFEAPRLLLAGLPFGLAVITFLLAHELGHYLACRYYGIRATLPYFIPFPPVLPLPGGGVLPFLVPGTMGAVIRILAPLKSRRCLFDIAVAGPLAGFLVALPILAVGLTQSRAVDLADLGPASISMGEPLVWGPMQTLFAPLIGEEQTLLAHPLAFVGWFALLVTAMNLLPIGQLDGGHLLYALFPRAHRAVSIATLLFMVWAGFTRFSGWLFFAMMVSFVLGTRHPRPVTFDDRLGALRVVLAILALLIFVGSFMLVPVSIDFDF